MQYLNPFSLFDLDPSTVLQEDIKMLKKQILAEFELQDTSEITIKGQTFDKNTLINLIDKLKDTDTFYFHEKVFTSPGLLAFLEQGDISKVDNENLIALFKDKRIVHQLSHYYIQIYSERLLSAIRVQNIQEVELLSNFYLPEKPKWKAGAYNRSFQFLMYYLRDAKSLPRKIEAAKLYWEVIALLPAYFDPVRDAYKAYWQYSKETDVIDKVKEVSKEAAPWVIGATVLGAIVWMFFRK